MKSPANNQREKEAREAKLDRIEVLMTRYGYNVAQAYNLMEAQDNPTKRPW